MSFETLKKFHEMGLILIPLTVKDGDKIPLIEYKGYAEKGQDLATLSGLYESYKNIKPLHWAVYCVNGITGLDFDCPKDYEVFFNNISTLTVKSPSGGYHPFLKSLIPCKAFKTFGLEIKTNELCTIAGDGYDLVNDLPIKEVQNIEELIKQLLPKIKSDRPPAHLKDIKIGDIASRFTEKKAEGHNYWAGFCPIHGDNKDAHLYIYEETNSWYCFKCKHGGDVIEFISFKDKITRKQAVRKLEELSGKKFDGIDSFFDDKGSFVPKRVGDLILKDHRFATTIDSKECFYYENGLYCPNGEAVIHQETNRLLGEKTTIHRINEVVNYIKIVTYTNRTNFDKDPFLINLNNGIYDLINYQLIPHNPEIIHTIRIPITYDPDADCPQIKKFFNLVMASPDDIAAVDEFFGYCLYKKYTIHKAFMLIGSGGNGKGTLLNLLQAFLGKNNCAHVPLQELDINRFSMSHLFGKLANICGDLSPDALQGTGVFKQLTGGDTLDAEIKFGGRIQFSNFAKMIFSTNQMPINHDDTPAFFDRWIIISFPNKFRNTDQDDKDLILKLTTPEELSGLFNLALKGLRRLLDNNKFSNNKSTEEIRDYYIRLSNPQHAFVIDMLDVSPESWIEKKDLYRKYTEYCRNNRLIPISDATFHKNLPKYITVQDYRPRTEKGRIYTWKGIKFKEYQSEKIDVKEAQTTKTDTQSNNGLSGLSGLPFSISNCDVLGENKDDKIGESGEYIDKKIEKIPDHIDHQDHPDTEIIKIAKSLSEWETHVHSRPLERQDIHKFLFWFAQNTGSTIPASRVKEHVWRIKGFTPDSVRAEQGNIKERSLGSVQISGEEVPVVEEL